VFEVGCERGCGVSGPDEVVDCHRDEAPLCFDADGSSGLDFCKERSISMRLGCVYMYRKESFIRNVRLGPRTNARATWTSQPYTKIVR